MVPKPQIWFLAPIVICNPSSRGSNVLFWPLPAPGIHEVHVLTFRHTCVYFLLLLGDGGPKEYIASEKLTVLQWMATYPRMLASTNWP